MDTKGWTYGAEFELADWVRSRKIPKRMTLDVNDVTMVNSNGIAVDPKGVIYGRGGEALAFPSSRCSGVADQLNDFMEKQPETTVNYRSNLHGHVRVPGLREDLKMLKRLARFNRTHLPTLLSLIEPIPEPSVDDYPDEEAYKGARKRFARRKVSHHFVLSQDITDRQLAARTVEEFINAEALHVTTGKLHWAIHPRAAVNVRQLIQTDTIEFRHFPGTTEPAEVQSALEWCRDYLIMALFDHKADPADLWRKFNKRAWPSFRPYSHWHEKRFLKTSLSSVNKREATEAIAKLLRKDGGVFKPRPFPE